MYRKQDYAYRQILGMIVSGQYRSGDRLPNEFELAGAMSVSRVTVRQAMARLISEGVVRRSSARSNGTVVCFQQRAEPRILIVNPSCRLEDASDPTDDVLAGIEEGCVRFGWKYDVITPDFLDNAHFQELGIVGIILNCNNFCGSLPWVKRLRTMDLPVVQAHGFHHDSVIAGCASVLNDYPEAYFRGLEFLARLGHRKIAFMNQDYPQAYRRSKLSEKNILKLMGKAGVRTDWNPFFYPLTEGFEKTVSRIQAMPDPPTALFCYSDWFAMLLYGIFAKRHIKVPGDIAVLGMGNIAGAAFLSPSLSTVDLGYRWQGRIAVELLNRYDEWKDLPVKPVVHVPSHLIPAASTDRMLFDFR